MKFASQLMNDNLIKLLTIQNDCDGVHIRRMETSTSTCNSLSLCNSDRNATIYLDQMISVQVYVCCRKPWPVIWSIFTSYKLIHHDLAIRNILARWNRLHCKPESELLLQLVVVGWLMNVSWKNQDRSVGISCYSLGDILHYVGTMIIR